MRIVLLQDVKGVGRRHEIKDVSDGYARNFLIAKGFARPADEEGRKFKHAIDGQAQARTEQLKKLAAKLEAMQLEFALPAGKKGELFGSVTREEIKNAILQRAPEAEQAEIELTQPLKTQGAHCVDVRLGQGIRGKVNVTVRSQP